MRGLLYSWASNAEAEIKDDEDVEDALHDV